MDIRKTQNYHAIALSSSDSCYHTFNKSCDRVDLNVWLLNFTFFVNHTNYLKEKKCVIEMNDSEDS